MKLNADDQIKRKTHFGSFSFANMEEKAYEQHRYSYDSFRGDQGKQSVRTLLRQNRGVSSVEISKTGIRGLERYAKKYGIDYAIRKDSSEVPPRYLVFFKAPDAEAFNSAFKEYSASLLSKDKRPSVLAKLHELVQAAAELPGKVRHKEQERGL